MFASCQVTHLASTFSVCSTNTPCCWGPACTQKPTIDFPSSPGDASYPAEGMHHILLRGCIISYSGDASYPTQRMHHILHKGCITSYSGDASYPTHGMRHIPLKGCVISNSGHLHALLAPDLLIVCLSDTSQCESSQIVSHPTHDICMHCWHLTS